MMQTIGIVKRANCVHQILHINESYKINTKKALLDVFTAIRILPENKRTLSGIHSFAHRSKGISLTEDCISFWNMCGIVGETILEGTPTYTISKDKSSDAIKLCEAYIRRSNYIKEYFVGDKISFHAVAMARQQVERALSFIHDKEERELLSNLTEELKTRNIKKAAFLSLELNENSRKFLGESLEAFLTHMYRWNYESVVMNESFSVGEDFVDKLTEEEVRTIINTLNIFLADEGTFNKSNLHEASNISIVLATSKAQQSAPNKIKEQLISIKRKLQEDAGIANAVGDGSGVSGMTVDDPIVRRKKKKKRKKFAGREVFEVSDDEYCKCMPGTIKYERWAKVFGEDSDIGNDIKNFSQRNPTTPFVIQNNKSGEMMYFTRISRPK